MANGVSFLLFILVWATGVIANCPRGYTQHGNSCYVINRVQASWAQASIYCHAIQAELVSIETKDEDTFLHNFLQNHGSNFDPPRFWVGGSDLLQEGEWTWTKTGSVIGSQGFSHWGPGQPDNGVEHLDEHCLELEAGHHWLWNDDDCEEFKHFICEKELFDTTIIG
ncbi:perlucin-like isoform X1 [Crassostrea angulata]|uniref:perlucin-like isoform X1 n=1 Tax=Magallana angulata TaxID=2784310 RepID=UPI00148A8AA0|nr:perlucin isoform X2 [Crassostrea gigas]XP_052704213.1 perlucin-like isoform X1 [Crassostrea angulata]